LRALGLVRDEAPSLPDVVTAQGQLYAWSANTLRRLFNNPWRLFFRFMAGLAGGWIAMGSVVWVTYRAQGFFNPQRWGNTLAVGLMFGLVMGFLVVFSGEFSERLRGFWPLWARTLLSATLGVFLGVMLWTQYSWMYLQFRLDEMYLPALLIGGIGITFGFLLTALFNLRSWVAISLTALGAYLPILLTWNNYQNTSDFDVIPLIYFLDDPGRVYSVAIPMAIVMAIGGHFPRIWGEMQQVVAPRWVKWRESLRGASQATDGPARVTGTTPAVSLAGDDDDFTGTMEMETELDPRRGRAKPVADPGITEVDPRVQQPLDSGDSRTDHIPKSQRVDIASGINVNIEPPTESISKDESDDK